MRKLAVILLCVLFISQQGIAATPTPAELQARALATYTFMQQKMWNPNSGNFIRRTDAPVGAQKSDAWGITIVLDAYANMVQLGMIKPEAIRQYFNSSTALYERTNNGMGARIIARQGDAIYIGGDDDLQWCAALAHLAEVTKDNFYLDQAKWVFYALATNGFWSKQPAGWSWNSNDRRPNGVSTAYGALSAARLYILTNDTVYRQWADAALKALPNNQVAYIPRDQMVAAEAAAILYKKTGDKWYSGFANATAENAVKEVDKVLRGKAAGERNPTDVGDLAEGLYVVADALQNKALNEIADNLIEFFHRKRTTADIQQSGHYSRYTTEGKPDLNGSYLGVPLTAQYLPEVAEMLKLETLELLKHK